MEMALRNNGSSKQSKQKQRPTKYQTIIDHLSSLSAKIPFFDHNRSLLWRLTLKQRSAVVKLCQAQVIPDPDETSTLARMMKDIPPVIIADNNALLGHSIPFLDYVQDLHGVDSPLLCAFILDMCRLLPCPVEEQISAKLDGWGKEISIMEGDANVNKIVWDVLFDPSRSDESMLSELPPNPCNVTSTTSSSSNKRNIGDADEDKANKKRKVFDLSGW